MTNVLVVCRSEQKCLLNVLNVMKGSEEKICGFRSSTERMEMVNRETQPVNMCLSVSDPFSQVR